MSRTTLWASWILKVSISSKLMPRWGFLQNFWTEIHPGNSSATVSAAAKGSTSTLWATQASKVSNLVQIELLPASKKVFIPALLVRSTTEPSPTGFKEEWPPLPSCADPSKQHLGNWVHSKDPPPAAWETPSPHVLQLLCIHFYLKFSFSPSSL